MCPLKQVQAGSLFLANENFVAKNFIMIILSCVEKPRFEQKVVAHLREWRLHALAVTQLGAAVTSAVYEQASQLSIMTGGGWLEAFMARRCDQISSVKVLVEITS